VAFALFVAISNSDYSIKSVIQTVVSNQ